MNFDLPLFTTTCTQIRNMKGSKSQAIQTIATLYKVPLNGAKNNTQRLNRVEAVVQLRFNMGLPVIPD